MTVNTRRLFLRLLPGLQIGTVCDVGSMDGADALAFSEVVPQANVYAFEPNPYNFRLMHANQALRERNIQLLPLAASNYDGEAEFFLVEADYHHSNERRGMSSLYTRTGELASTAVVRITTTRLDTFLAGKCAPDVRLALWIDAEGAAFEVIEGCTGLARQVQLLHVEVESTPCIAQDQKLYPQVKTLLARLGFTELATDRVAGRPQFNALFVRSELPRRLRRRVHASLLCARLRHLIAHVLRTVCPACLRRYQLLVTPRKP
jgi:FkbM family methyltransferase